MKNFVKAAVLSLSSMMAVTSAFAAPQEHQPQHQPTQQGQQPQHKPAPNQIKGDQKGSKQPPRNEQNKYDAKKQNLHANQKADRPSQNWKAGQKVPSQFHGPQHKVDYKQFKQLSKPGKNQEWIKVNGDYVLMNTSNHKVIKVVS